MIHRMDPAPEGREPMPRALEPMKAKLAKLPADDEGWGFEIKWDGVRAIAFCETGRVKLVSRSGKDITQAYPEIGEIAKALGGAEAVLDGEVVAFDEAGRPSFQRLQRRMHVREANQVRRLRRDVPVTYVVFDVLHLDGESLLGLTYEERRARLQGLELDGDCLAHPRLPPRRRRLAAQADPLPGARGSRRQAARLDLQAGQARARLDQGQEHRRPGGRGRRMAAREGKALGVHRALLTGYWEGRGTSGGCATAARSGPGSARPS